MAMTVVEAGRAQQRSPLSRDRRKSSCPTGSRRAVAATTAAPHTATPAPASARQASTSVEPVVTTSSTTMTGSVGTDRRTPNAPARLAARACDDRPAWSATGRATRRHARTSAATPPCLRWRIAWRVIRSSGSWPRLRTARSDEGAGTKVTVVRPGARRSARRPRTDQLRARPSAPAKDSRLCSLWATSAARATSSYAATAYTGGSPAGTGDGLVRAGGCCARRRAQVGHSAGPGAAQPTQALPSSRSPAAPVRARHCVMWATVPGSSDGGHRLAIGCGGGSTPGELWTSAGVDRAENLGRPGVPRPA